MGTERPKGYMTWNAKPESLALLEQVREVLEAERSELPVTARYLFYKLVALYDFPKTENDYSRLCGMLVKARRAQIIPFGWIRDDSANSQGYDSGYDSVEQFWEDLRERGEYYGRRARQDQPKRIELWSEGNSPVPMLARAAQPYGVSVTGTGGFPGVTLLHRLAKRVVNANEPTVLLHIGDYDPSGESIFDTIREDVGAFVWGEIGEEASEKFLARRIGLTWQQVVDYTIETAPPKKSDGRSARWEDEGRTETAQLEAVDASLLREWVAAACEEYTDMDLLREVEATADGERERILEGMQRLFDGFDEGDDGE